MTSIKRYAHFLLAWALVACTPPAKAPNAAGPVSDDSPATKLKRVGDDDVVIQVDKWEPSGVSNTGLVAHYSWEGQPRRRADVSNAGSGWQVRFLEQPKAGTEATIEYEFEYSITDKQRAELNEIAKSVLIDTVAIWLKCLDGAKPCGDERSDEWKKATAIRLKDEKVIEKLDEAKQYRNSKTNGRDLLISKLGLAVNADNNSLYLDSPPDDLRDAYEAYKLVALRDEDLRKNLSPSEPDDKESVVVVKGDCREQRDAARAEAKDVSVDGPIDFSWRTLKDACAASLTERAKNSLSGANDKIAAYETAVTNALSSKDPEVKVDAPFNEASTAIEADGTASDDEKKAAMGEVWLMKAAVAGHQRKIALEKWHTVLEEWVGDLDTAVRTLTTEQTAEQIYKQEARRRMYDAATGIVYVLGLDDVVLFNAISVCPGGCLRQDDGTDEYGLGSHTWAIDLGVGVGIEDQHPDPRHDDAVGIFLGSSWNPVDVVRLSHGLYWFENQQTEEWNVSVYAGVSVNILHAAALLGIVGRSLPSGAELEAAKNTTGEKP